MLGEEARVSLGRALATHVADVVEECGLIPLLVTDDPDVAGWATVQGLASLPDPGQGLDAAAGTGVEWANRTDSSWIVLHADLPLLQVEEVRMLAQAIGDGLEPIAPSADGGTSAIGSSGPFEFSFGEGSFQRHLARLASPHIVPTLGLLHDVDSPDDLASATAHPRGRWLTSVVR